jgi:NH3-dependent NAD+ synthetase
MLLLSCKGPQGVPGQKGDTGNQGPKGDTGTGMEIIFGVLKDSIINFIPVPQMKPNSHVTIYHNNPSVNWWTELGEIETTLTRPYARIDYVNKQVAIGYVSVGDNYKIVLIDPQSLSVRPLSRREENRLLGMRSIF